MACKYCKFLKFIFSNKLCVILSRLFVLICVIDLVKCSCDYKNIYRDRGATLKVGGAD